MQSGDGGAKALACEIKGKSSAESRADRLAFTVHPLAVKSRRIASVVGFRRYNKQQHLCQDCAWRSWIKLAVVRHCHLRVQYPMYHSQGPMLWFEAIEHGRAHLQVEARYWQVL